MEGRIYVCGRKRQYGLEAIDYVIVNKEAIEKVEEFKVDSRVDSDHMPLKVIWKKGEDRKQEER